ncbi:helix-turn-helix domain-containing protein [Enterococcus faecalis]|uniref:helix-turn-helix transcriptional regulator n=1 Tax=Enterococcus faecalis TaxID=1351 RepID=UPI002945C079|nr:helix-turn-helix domain-containing protein [Enterococcus faecalis]ELS0448040.1 helix-turn-helix domain-containing protein [Enterococcus faecalis]MDV7769724.1 helix-turn-helix domain-containing protein [Enterococcus faecalis]
MTEMKILISDEQLKGISDQLHNLISKEIEKIKTQENLQHRYMNKKQTCNYLQVSNNTLDNWIEQGLPLIKIGGSTRFDRLAIDNWLENIEN